MGGAVVPACIERVTREMSMFGGRCPSFDFVPPPRRALAPPRPHLSISKKLTRISLANEKRNQIMLRPLSII